MLQPKRRRDTNAHRREGGPGDRTVARGRGRIAARRRSTLSAEYDTVLFAHGHVLRVFVALTEAVQRAEADFCKQKHVHDSTIFAVEFRSPSALERGCLF
jgi:broad specificity phosphatase PhoE